MITYNKGDIILVPFPFSDRITMKKRPSVIISSNAYNTISSDIVIMAITSRIDSSLQIGECLLKNWQEAGLLRVSSLKPAISTIEQKLVLKRLGKLSPDDLKAMEQTLKRLLDIYD